MIRGDMMKIFFLYFLLLVSVQSFGQTSNKELRPPFSESFYKDFTDRAISQFVATYQRIQTTDEFAESFLTASSPEEKAFIIQKLQHFNRLPKLKLSASTLNFYIKNEIISLDIVNIFTGQMRINGKLWQMKNTLTLYENYESILKMLNPKESVLMNIFIPKAQAVPPVLFAASAAALLVSIPAATMSVGLGLGCLGSGAMLTDSSEEAWRYIKKECPSAVKEPWILYWQTLKAIYKGTKNITGFNRKEQKKSTPEPSASTLTR